MNVLTKVILACDVSRPIRSQKSGLDPDLLFVEHDDEREYGRGHSVEGDEVVDGAKGLTVAPITKKGENNMFEADY